MYRRTFFKPLNDLSTDTRILVYNCHSHLTNAMQNAPIADHKDIREDERIQNRHQNSGPRHRGTSKRVDCPFPCLQDDTPSCGEASVEMEQMQVKQTNTYVMLDI